MTDLPIAPDLSGEWPTCQTSCGSFRPGGGLSYCAVTNRGIARFCVCLPYTRHLKLLSERMCGGCRDYIRDARGGLCDNGMYRARRKPDESCSRWVQRG